MHSIGLIDVLNTRTAFLSHFLLMLWIGSDQSHDAFLQQVCVRSVIPLLKLLITSVERARARAYVHVRLLSLYAHVHLQ